MSSSEASFWATFASIPTKLLTLLCSARLLARWLTTNVLCFSRWCQVQSVVHVTTYASVQVNLAFRCVAKAGPTTCQTCRVALVPWHGFLSLQVALLFCCDRVIQCVALQTLAKKKGFPPPVSFVGLRDVYVGVPTLLCTQARLLNERAIEGEGSSVYTFTWNRQFVGTNGRNRSLEDSLPAVASVL